MTNRRMMRLEEPDTAPLHLASHPPARILVVEDEPVIRHLSTQALMDSGYDVDEAEDGAAAWQALSTGDYDLLVTDNNMPNLSGVELLMKLHAARLSLPAILVSGALPVGELRAHPWLHIDATLTKPFSTDQLLETVRNVLRVPDAMRDPVEPRADWKTPPTDWRSPIRDWRNPPDGAGSQTR